MEPRLWIAAPVSYFLKGYTSVPSELFKKIMPRAFLKLPGKSIGVAGYQRKLEKCFKNFVGRESVDYS